MPPKIVVKPSLDWLANTAQLALPLTLTGLDLDKSLAAYMKQVHARIQWANEDAIVAVYEADEGRTDLSVSAWDSGSMEKNLALEKDVRELCIWTAMQSEGWWRDAGNHEPARDLARED